jgi:leader peptidase (prepilin peptidase)/N-methyltransferase
VFDPALSPLFESTLGPWTALAVGVVVGSFANVCVFRLPRGRSLVRPGSSCPGCATPIQPRDNVPVLSYLWLRGRCRHCGARISPRYPLVELANGLLYLALALRMPPGLRAVCTMAFVTALLVLSLIDLESALSAAGGYACFALVARVAKAYYGQEALGQGDWKMAALLGAFLGWRTLLLTVFLACLAGALVGVGLIAARRGSRLMKIPLGTFLGAAGIVAVFVADPVIGWYRRLLDV